MKDIEPSAERRQSGRAMTALPCKRDSFGLRTRRVHSPLLMREIADDLRRIGGERETEAARAYVDEVLHCPYWTLRISAIRVLGRWGGRRNKRWLMERASRRTSHDFRSDRWTRWNDLETFTARTALRPLLKVEDAQWLLDAWFTDAGWRFDELELVLPLIPDKMFLIRLKAEMASDDSERRMGALRMVRARRAFFGARPPIEHLLSDADPDIRRFASVLLRCRVR